ncbi:hypothetical protein SLS64_013668 [Diaporthe eres]
MEVILSQSSKLKAQVRLGRAINAFYESLDTENKAIFNSYRDAAHAAAPGLGDIRQIAAEIDLKARRPCGDRFKRLLEALQQFVAVGDVIIGSTQNMLAAGVWSVARLTVIVMTGYTGYREKVSEIFLDIGRSAPRHAELASIYPGAGRLQSAMMEYSIVVVELCHSLFQLCPLHRVMVSLKTSLTDPQLQKIKGTLASWSREINDEVALLQSRKLEDKGFRSLISSISESDRRRKRARARAKWLDACADFDYERQYNLTRRSGNAEDFLDDPSYRNWKAGNGPSVLFCEGILGSGKSVLMANMVGDLLLDKASKIHTVAFFFVSDDTTGHRARTALGSLARQILESLPDLQWTDILEEESRSLTMDRLTRILAKVVPSTTRIYLILDGFDEFPEIERRILVEQLKELQSWVQLRICISWRLEAKSRARQDFDVFGQHATLEIPRINPEIERFVKAEIEALLDTGELSIRDDAIVDEIRERLVEGADGMFLWVTLQLHAICLEDEDTIHEALDNLPRSLPEIFHRILQRNQERVKRYQTSILKILVAAFRPLTTTEVGEALSIAQNSSATPPRLHIRQIRDVRENLSSCGSLVMIDEQYLTVHLVHQSVRQFLLGEMVDTQDYREWQFAADTANLHMADITMRYLSVWTDKLDVAKPASRVSPSTTTQSPQVFLPNPIAIRRATQAELSQGKLSKLLNLASHAKLNGSAAAVDVGKTAERLRPGSFKKTSSECPDQASHLPAMDLLAYARAFWMLHSAPITEDDGLLYLLWSQVLTISESKDWLRWDTLDVANHGDEIPETMMWAVVHSHNTLLDTVLRKQKRRLRLLNCCLNAFLEMSPLPRLSPQMAARFLTLQLFLNRSSMSNTQVILGMEPDFRYNNYACLYAAVFSRNYHTARAILRAIGGPVVFNALSYPLLEFSVSCMDVHMTHLLLFHGVRPLPSSRVHKSALALAMSRLRPGCDPSSILVASWFFKSWASTAYCPPHHLARAVVTFKEVANKRDFEPGQFVSVPTRGWLAYYILWAAEKPAPWLRLAFTLKSRVMYATVIAFMDASKEYRAMLVFVLVAWTQSRRLERG